MKKKRKSKTKIRSEKWESFLKKKNFEKKQLNLALNFKWNSNRNPL